MKYKVFAFLFSVLLFSCNTTVHIPVPGEPEVIKSNLYIEYQNIADTYMELEKFDKAVEFYKKAKKHKALYWSCLYKMGRAQALAKNYKEARKIYNKLLKRDKENVDLQVSIAYLYAMEGKLSSAISIYEYLYTKNPGNADILVNYINVLISDEQFEYAKLKFEDLKNNYPDNSSIETFQKKIDEYDNEKDPSASDKKEE